MLCLPALTPVANDAHAVADSGECVVCSGNMPPPCASFEMLGSLPSSIHFFSRWGSMPSNPRMTSFRLTFDGPRFVPPEQASAQSATATAAIASSLTDLRMEIGRNYNLPHGTDRARYPTRAQAVAPGAGVHAVRRRLARAGDRGVHGDPLGGPHAFVDAAGNPRRVGADRGRRQPALHLSGVVVAGLPGLSHRADGGPGGRRGCDDPYDRAGGRGLADGLPPARARALIA